MNEWILTHKKAIGGFVSAALTLVSAVLASQVLPDAAAETVRNVLVALTPLFTLLGVSASPKNKTPA